jgi:uncharacterized surface protein with fasciclin (FAS1) repeats
MKELNLFILGLLTVTTLFFASCDEEIVTDPEPEVTTAFDFISASSSHTSLTAALEAADLATTLDDEDATFTVFAPNDDAFAAFLTANNFATLGDVPADLLKNVLLNHVLGIKANASSLSNGYVSTLSATSYGTEIYQSLYINTDNGVVLNGDVTVTGADNDVENGTIHLVDKVIGLPTVVTFATSNPALTSLVAALTRSDLTTDFVGALSGTGPFTVFAPTNDAFQALLDSDPNWTTLADIPVATLEAVLAYHVTSAGNVRSTDLTDGQSVPTLSGMNTLTIDLSDTAAPKVVGTNSTAGLVTTLLDIQGNNGVVHVIDTVLLP